MSYSLATGKLLSDINQIATSLRLYRTDQKPVPADFKILTYDVGSGKRLIIDADGGPRIAAARALRDDWPLNILELCISAPLKDAVCVCLQLLHHTEGGVSAEMLREPDWLHALPY